MGRWHFVNDGEEIVGVDHLSQRASVEFFIDSLQRYLTRAMPVLSLFQLTYDIKPTWVQWHLEHFFTLCQICQTRPKLVYGRRDLAGGILGPEYSSSRYILGYSQRITARLRCAAPIKYCCSNSWVRENPLEEVILELIHPIWRSHPCLSVF